MPGREGGSGVIPCPVAGFSGIGRSTHGAGTTASTTATPTLQVMYATGLKFDKKEGGKFGNMGI
jgi:hypothetical protein